MENLELVSNVSRVKSGPEFALSVGEERKGMDGVFGLLLSNASVRIWCYGLK